MCVIITNVVLLLACCLPPYWHVFGWKSCIFALKLVNPVESTCHWFSFLWMTCLFIFRIHFPSAHVSLLFVFMFNFACMWGPARLCVYGFCAHILCMYKCTRSITVGMCWCVSYTILIPHFSLSISLSLFSSLWFGLRHAMVTSRAEKLPVI